MARQSGQKFKAESQAIIPFKIYQIAPIGYGDIKLSENDGIIVYLDIIIAADELCLSLLVEYLQDRIISKKYQAIKNNLCYCLTMTNRYQNLSKLYLHFNSLMKNRAHMIFQSFDFNLLDKDILISLLKSSDLMMDEIDVWKCVIKWCCLQQPNLPYPNNLKQKDLEVLKIRCRDFLPFINFNHISKNDFISNIKPLKSIFDPEFFEKIDDYYNLASKNSLIHYNLLLSKRRGINSKLIGICQLYLISDWLDGLTPSSTYLRSPSSSGLSLYSKNINENFVCKVFNGKEQHYEKKLLYSKQELQRGMCTYNIDEIEVFQIIKKKILC
ncbi:8251_t:CDS:2 [Entrophospora sp. SA101]|nr:8251_t:CDS:2 [Entrophospora sp. SA101]